MSSFWPRLASRLGLACAQRTYALDAELHRTLSDLAARQRRPPAELAAELIADGLDQWLSRDELWARWETLSGRERDVAALACLGYTNRQIAARLTISAETVKTHLHNLLVKFALHGRGELRQALQDWDFSAWERPA